MSEGKTESVADSVQNLYKALDAHTEKVLKTQFNSSCTKGCSHCCYLLATITFAEGLLIAEKLMVGPDWRMWLAKLRLAAQKVDYTSITRTNYFRKGQPCVFLGEDKLCRIYDIRPACCRYHIVTGPPENCSFLAPETTKTISLDLTALEEEVWKLSDAVGKYLKRPDMMIAPLPIMVLACMVIITPDDIEERAEVMKAIEGIRMPGQWMRDCGGSLIREENMRPERMSLEEGNKRGLVK